MKSCRNPGTELPSLPDPPGPTGPGETQLPTQPGMSTCPWGDALLPVGLRGSRALANHAVSLPRADFAARPI